MGGCRITAVRLHVDSGMSAAALNGLPERIKALAKQRNAVILAHNYERPEVQDLADFVGDSLGLSREAAKTHADVIVFCGVHFMAETAAILSPRKTVLLPDLAAGCSLADTINADQLRAWKAEHPGRGRRLVREHDGRGEGGKRLLLHVRQRGRNRQLDSRGQGNSLPARPLPRRTRSPCDRAVEHPCLARRVPRARRHHPAQPGPAARRTPGCRAARAPRVRLRNERGRGHVGGSDSL